MTDKTFTELIVAERFLPHFNQVHKSLYRIDYSWILGEPEGRFPDIRLIDLKQQSDPIDVEITKAPDLHKREAQNSEWLRFMGDLTEITREARKKYGVSVSIDINAETVLTRRKREADKKLLEENIEKMILGAGFIKRPDNLKAQGFEVLDNFTAEISPEAPVLGSGISFSGGSLDPLERVLIAIKNKENYDSADCILLIHIDTQIGEYYSRQLEEYFSTTFPNFREVWISESTDTPRAFYWFRPIAGSSKE